MHISGFGLNVTIMTYDHHQPKLTPASCETRRVLQDSRLLANIYFHSINFTGSSPAKQATLSNAYPVDGMASYGEMEFR